MRVRVGWNMHADPLFLDLRIALGNAEPIRTILLEHLNDGAGGNSTQRSAPAVAGLGPIASRGSSVTNEIIDSLRDTEGL